MARSWDALLEHSFLYPFLALFAALIFFEIFVTLRSGLLVGYDNGEYLFTAFLILHGKSSIFSYEYPLLPAFYTLVILALPNPTAAYAFSDVVTGVILTALFAAGYFLFLRDTASKIGGLAGGAALATIPLFMDEVGWGGQAQLLAFVFGALALHNVLAWGEAPRLRDGIAVGVLVSLAALSEGWSAFFFVMAVAACVLLQYRGRTFSRSVFPAVAVAVVPIALVYGFYLVSSGANLGNGLSGPWLYYVGAQNSALRLAERFAVGQPVLLYAYLALAAAWAIVACLRLLPNQNQYRPLMLPVTIAFVLQALLLTSMFDGDRGVYFAALPVAVVFARMAASVGPSMQALEQVAEAEEGTRRRPFRLAFRQQAPAATTILVITLLGLQIGYAGVHLTGALTYYSTTESDLSQLTFLRNQPGNVVMLGLASGGVFPYFFATGKTVYASTEPTLYVSPAQKEGTMNATLMQAGPRWIDAGGARIVDAAGLDTEPAPGVFVYTGAYDFQAFYLDDALLPFSYSPVSNPSAVEESSPYAANSLTKSTSGPATLLSNYSWPDLGLTKTVRVDPSGTVHIGLDFQFVKAFPRSIEVRLFAYPGTTLLSTQNSSGKYSVGLSEAYADLWVSEPLSSEVSITESNISLSSVDFLPSDELGIPELQFFLNSTDTAPRDVQANLTIQTAGLVISAPELVTESKWFRSVGASWVVAPLDSGTALIDRLLEDPALLLYRTTSDFAIFRVA